MEMLITGLIVFAIVVGSLASPALAAQDGAFASPIGKGHGSLELQFQRWGYFDRETVETLVSVKNTTDKDYATVTWSCRLWDKTGHLVGRDVPVSFNIVPKQAVQSDTQYLYAAGGMFHQVACKLVHKEERSHENERLYVASRKAANLPVDETPFWHPNRLIDGSWRPGELNSLGEPIE
jgi:hypothetical protein